MDTSAFFYFKDKLYPVTNEHSDFVWENIELFGISQDELDEIANEYNLNDKDGGDPESANYALVDEAVRKGAIQIRNIPGLSTFITVKDHSYIDDLVDCIVDNPDCVQSKKMNITFLEEPDVEPVTVNSIEQLYEV